MFPLPQAVLRAALRAANLLPDDVCKLEMHGTGGWVGGWVGGVHGRGGWEQLTDKCCGCSDIPTAQPTNLASQPADQLTKPASQPANQIPPPPNNNKSTDQQTQQTNPNQATLARTRPPLPLHLSLLLPSPTLV